MSRRQFGNVRKLPSGRWQARFRGPSGQLLPAPRTFETKADAARYLSAMETDLFRGAYLDPAAGRMAVAEWGRMWLERPGKRPASVVRDRQALAAFDESLGPLSLSAVTPVVLQAAVDARGRQVAPATVARDFATVKALFGAAVDAELLSRSPARRIKLPAVLPPERVTLGPAELAQLVASLPSKDRALVLVAAVLGLRWSEAVALRVRDIDFERATLRVAQTVEELAGRVRIVPYGKTRASLRTMAVPAFLLDVLAAHLREHRTESAADPDALVFVGPRGGILRRNFVRRILHPAAERAGLPPTLTFHGLRHLAVSSMADAGVPYNVTQARAGHTTARMTVELYSHRSTDADRAAAQALDAHFGHAFTARDEGP